MTTATRPVRPAPSQITTKLPRSSTLVRKREDDLDLESSSPTKRHRVTFDSDVEVRMVEKWEKPPAVIQDAVRRALQSHTTGDSTDYDKVKAVYAPPEDSSQEHASPTAIRNHTAALLSNVSRLNKSCTDLVHSVLSSDWLGRSDDYVHLFVQFLANLVSAQGLFLADSLRMLVENLTTAPPSQRQIHDLPSIPRSKYYSRAHKALQYLLQIVPSACRILLSSLTTQFPHPSDSRRAHVVYVHNLLQIAEYAPVLQMDILALITERLVKIDLQVQEDLEDLAEDVEEGVVQHVPQAQLDSANFLDDDQDSDEESDTDEEMDADVLRTRDITKSVEKMDCILDMLFTYYDQKASATSLDSRQSIVDILMGQFQTIILPTHRSRHTQFLLFHFVQQSSARIDAFVAMCAQTSFDKRRPAMIRQSAAAYLASFVARGVHVSSEIVVEVWDYISTELKRLHRESEAGCRGPDLQRYSTYYSLVQALLYIFCFRWRDLEARPDDDDVDNDLPSIYGEERQWRAGVKETFQLNIFSKLNPLKVCSPAIVTEFARIAHHLHVIYVYHLLETNKRVRLSQCSGPSSYTQLNRETALTARRDEDHQHLDEYFPFDPYHLPKSKRWIEGDYREWVGIPGLDDQEASESESGEEHAGDGDVEEATGTEKSDE
ncbi:MAG: hypothetical protein LQ352_004364 [Teloschistes flavicans]|nr:MAG: hypothetical protein LQ352_004364 [Teloschistes flavicans]